MEKQINYHFENNRLRFLEPGFLRDEDYQKDGEEKAERKARECASAVELEQIDEYLMVLPRQLKRNVSTSND